MASIEPTGRGKDRAAFRPGDFVEVHFGAKPDSGFIGYIALINDARLVLRAHEPFGDLVSNRETCISEDTYIPMRSVAWIRHLSAKPVDCPCGRGLV